MMIIRKLIASAVLAFTLVLSQTAFAQKDGREDFNAAVDQINCETVKFIHREEGRKSTADKMECFTFESIYKSIPEDEASSTGRLCKDINHLKEKYNQKEDLGKQLDAVINFAYGKISRKKRKGDVEEYKTRMEEYKKEALESYNQSSSKPETANNKPAAAPSRPASSGDTVKAKSQQSVSTQSNEIMPSDSGKPEKSDKHWLGLLALGFSLVSLLLAGFALYRVGQYKEEGGGSRNNDIPEYTRPSAPLVRESPDNYKLLEKKLNEEIKGLRAYLEGRISEMNANSAKSKDNNHGLKEFEFSPSDLEEELPFITPALVAVPKNEPVPEKATPEADADQPIEEEGQAKDLFGNANKIENSEEDKAAGSFEDELDSNLLPTYRFTALALDGKHFEESQFTESGQPDSIFEIETYSDVPGRAFFSILNYPEVVQKVFANPAVYLEPYCKYDESPEGKSRIILLEEGILQKEGSHWAISSKAHIKFE